MSNNVIFIGLSSIFKTVFKYMFLYKKYIIKSDSKRGLKNDKNMEKTDITETLICTNQNIFFFTFMRASANLIPRKAVHLYGKCQA